jgi:hypothetical protein
MYPRPKVELVDLVAARSRSSINASTLQRAMKLWSSTWDVQVAGDDKDPDDGDKDDKDGKGDAAGQHEKLLKKKKRRATRVTSQDDLLTPVMLNYLASIVMQNRVIPPIVIYGADGAGMQGLDNVKLGVWLPIPHFGFWAPDQVLPRDRHRTGTPFTLAA